MCDSLSSINSLESQWRRVSVSGRGLQGVCPQRATPPSPAHDGTLGAGWERWPRPPGSGVHGAALQEAGVVILWPGCWGCRRSCCVLIGCWPRSCGRVVGVAVLSGLGAALHGDGDEGLEVVRGGTGGGATFLQVDIHVETADTERKKHKTFWWKDSMQDMKSLRWLTWCIFECMQVHTHTFFFTDTDIWRQWDYFSHNLYAQPCPV